MDNRYIMGEGIFSQVIEDLKMAPDISSYVIICGYKDGQIGYSWELKDGEMNAAVATLEAVKMKMIFKSSILFKKEEEDDEE